MSDQPVGPVSVTSADGHRFRQLLMEWYADHARRFAWHEATDPYAILLTEVLLQRTQAPQVANNFGAILAAFPTAKHLASADLSAVQTALRPLGLIKRAPTLQRMAAVIVERFGGSVPRHVEDLLTLPGIGRYTATATACFAFGASVAVVDANVIRVLSRYFGVRSERARPREDPMVWNLAENLLPMTSQDVVKYNRALIDFAALVCRARRPHCGNCPLRDTCAAVTGVTT